jgi:hypothetical protein
MHIRCGSTAYCLAILPGKRPDLVDIKRPFRSNTCLVRSAGFYPAESHLSWCRPAESLRVATETRPTRNISGHRESLELCSLAAAERRLG